MSIGIGSHAYSGQLNFDLPGLTGSKVEEGSVWLEELAEICRNQSIDEAVGHLKQQWARAHQAPGAVKPLIGNPHYLLGWGALAGAQTAVNNLGDLSIKEGPGIYLGLGTTLLAIVDGLTTQGGYLRTDFAAQELEASLSKLAQAYTNNCSQDNLLKIQCECADRIQKTYGLIGPCELGTQFVTDAFSAFHTTIQTLIRCVTTAQIQHTALEIADGIGGSAAVALTEARSVNALMDALKSAGVDTRPLQAAIDEQVDHFKVVGQVGQVADAVGIFGNGAGAVRAVLELFRFSNIREMLNERKERLERAWRKLKDRAGGTVLSYLLHGAMHKISSNSWALFGSGARLAGSVTGIVLKALSLAGFAMGPAGPIVGSVVMFVFWLKSLMQTHHEREAGRFQNQITNTLKAVGHQRPDSPSPFHEKLAEDLRKLVDPPLNRGMEQEQINTDAFADLKYFLEAMERPELLPDFEEFKNADAQKRFAMLGDLLDMCLSPSEARYTQQLLESKHAGLELEGLMRRQRADDEEKPAAPKKVASAEDVPLPKEAKRGNSAEERFARNTPDKAVAALSGAWPGIHMHMGHEEGLEEKAAVHLKSQFGSTVEVERVIQVGKGLTKNNQLWRQGVFAFFYKSRTWELTAEGSSMLKALGSGPKSLSASTLAAALTSDNARLIAACRFDPSCMQVDADKVQEQQRQDSLAQALESVHRRNALGRLMAMTEALATCNGKQLKAEILTMARGYKAEEIQDILRTALMLSHGQGGDTEKLDLTVGDFLFTACKNKWPADDIGQALALLTGKQLHANIAHRQLREELAHMLGAGLTETCGTTIFMVRRQLDPRWNLYASDIAQGKSAIKDAPDWLLSGGIKDFSKGVRMNKACESALQQQMQWRLENLTADKAPVSLLWPDRYFERTTITIGKSRVHVSSLIVEASKVWLHLDTAKYFTSKLRKLAQLQAKWTQKEPSLEELKPIIEKGYLQGGANDPLVTMALQRIFALQGFVFSNDAHIQALAGARDLDGFKQLLGRLASFERARMAGTLVTEDARTLVAGLTSDNVESVAKSRPYLDETEQATLEKVLQTVARDTAHRKALVALVDAMARRQPVEGMKYKLRSVFNPTIAECIANAARLLCIKPVETTPVARQDTNDTTSANCVATNGTEARNTPALVAKNDVVESLARVEGSPNKNDALSGAHADLPTLYVSEKCLEGAKEFDIRFRTLKLKVAKKTGDFPIRIHKEEGSLKAKENMPNENSHLVLDIDKWNKEMLDAIPAFAESIHWSDEDGLSEDEDPSIGLAKEPDFREVNLPDGRERAVFMS